MPPFRRAATISFLGVVAAAVPTSAWAEAPAINHDAVGCIVVDRFPRFEARFDPAENVSRGRLRFRSTGGAHWYSVPMKKELEAFVGVLPKPTPKLKSLDYYIEVTATDFATGRTREYAPEVVSGLGACQGDKITAGSLGSASIILEAPAGAPAVPAGFSSVGVVSATGAAVAVATGAAAGGVSTTAIVLGGVAVAGGAAAAVVASGGPPPTTAPPFDGTYQGSTTVTVFHTCWNSTYDDPQVIVTIAGASGSARFNGTAFSEGGFPPPPGLPFSCGTSGPVSWPFTLPLSVSGNVVSGAGVAGSSNSRATLQGTISGNTIAAVFTLSIDDTVVAPGGTQGTGTSTFTLVRQ